MKTDQAEKLQTLLRKVRELNSDKERLEQLLPVYLQALDEGHVEAWSVYFPSVNREFAKGSPSRRGTTSASLFSRAAGAFLVLHHSEFMTFMSAFIKKEQKKLDDEVKGVMMSNIKLDNDD